MKTHVFDDIQSFKFKIKCNLKPLVDRKCNTECSNEEYVKSCKCYALYRLV